MLADESTGQELTTHVHKAWRLVALLATFAPEGVAGQAEGVLQGSTGSLLSWAVWERLQVEPRAAWEEADALFGECIALAQGPHAEWHSKQLARLRRAAKKGWLPHPRPKDSSLARTLEQ